MGKIYSKGDIVFFKNIMLHKKGKSTTIDVRIDGHPFILLEDVNDIGEVVRCLKCSSNESQKNKDRKYLIPHKKLRGRKHKDNYVDLAYVYNIQIKCMDEVVGTVSNNILNDLIEATKDM